MIEELTPQILMVSMLLIIVTAPILTLLLSVLLLWGYRRTVTRAMAASEGFCDSQVKGGTAEPSQLDDPTVKKRTTSPASSNLYQRAIQAPWHNALQTTIAVLASAFVFSAAAQIVYPLDLGLPGFFVGVWIYTWPAVPCICRAM